ncbi:MAG: hypothetical protein HZA31_00900 [Opitutae bacterium]|nr:hypothetical protein [Opitutae bacterium]
MTSNPATPPDAPINADAERTSRWCLALAAGVLLAWFGWFASVRTGGLCDEMGHIGSVYHFQEHKPGWPAEMPMLPGYHFLLLSFTGWHPDQFKMRLVTCGLSLLGLVTFAGAWRRFHGAPPGPATLLFALLPILQPYTAMVYTDAPALAAVFGLWWAHLAGQRTLAALLLVIACLLRQTNLLWGAFVLAWEAVHTLWPPPGGRKPGDWRAALQRAWQHGGGLLFVLAAAAAIVTYTGRLTLSDQHGNQAHPNIATLHFAGVLCTLLGLPLWPRAARTAGHWWRERWQRQRGLTLAAGAAAVLTTVLLARTFANSHIWNRELFWPDATFTLLRNWPLVWIDTHPWLRWASAANLVLLGLATPALLAGQPHRRELVLALVFGVVPLALNFLVEPRYFIPLCAFGLFFARLDRRAYRTLALWFGLLCLIHAPFIARGLSLW